MSEERPHMIRKSVYIKAAKANRASGALTDDQRSSRTRSRKSQYSTAGHVVPLAKAGIRVYQPTYRLVSQRPLDVERLFRVTKYTVDTSIARGALEQYRPQRANRFCQSLAREIQKRIRYEDFDRFRFVVMITKMEKANQSGHSKMGFLWDAEHDRWTSYQFETREYIINAVVLGVYYEWTICKLN